MVEDAVEAYGPESGLYFIHEGEPVDIPWREREPWGLAKRALSDISEGLIAFVDGKAIQDGDTPESLEITSSVVYLVCPRSP